MINLLPPERAQQIKYGRRNSVLRKWLIGAGVAIAGLVLIIVGGIFYIDQQSKELQSSIAITNKQLADQNITQVQADATEISNSVKVINQVLNREIRFSDLIQSIGKIMPPGTALSGLTLADVNGSIDLSVNARNYASAAQVAANLNDPENGLFSKVDIINTHCSSNAAIPAYPCSAEFRALFSDSASVDFLSVPKAGN